MELDIIRFIQSIHNDFFDVLFQLITMFGEEVIITSILAYIYWNKNKEIGKKIAYSSFTSILVNNTLKGLINAKRPIGEPGIRSLRVETATGSSFPSGHSQNAAVFYSSLAREIKNKIIYLVMGILIFLVGLSRLYLGVHYPRDVIFGIIFGVLVSIISYKLHNKVKNKMYLYVFTFTIFIPVVIFNSSIDLIKGMGTFLGFIIGVFIEEKYICFSTEGNSFSKLLRLLMGLILLLIIKIGLKIVFPTKVIFDFIRYTFIGIFAMAIWPYIFKKFNI